RKALETCGYFNEKMESAQDYELWLRISKDYEVDYVNIPLVKYYAHDGDKISTNNNKKIQGLEELNNINLWYLRDNPKKYNIRKTRIISYYYKKDCYIKALIKIWEAFKIYPFNKHLLNVFIKIIINEIKS